MGRKALIERDDLTDEVIKYLENGEIIKKACRLVGIAEKTFYNYRNRARKALQKPEHQRTELERRYIKFHRRIKKARSISESERQEIRDEFRLSSYEGTQEVLPDDYNEDELRDWIATNYEDVRLTLGLEPVETVHREARLQRCQMDVLFRHRDGNFTVIECKIAKKAGESDRLRTLYCAIGQVLWYKKALEDEFSLFGPNVNLVIACDWQEIPRFLGALNDIQPDVMVYRCGKTGEASVTQV